MERTLYLACSWVKPVSLREYCGRYLFEPFMLLGFTDIRRTLEEFSFVPDSWFYVVIVTTGAYVRVSQSVVFILWTGKLYFFDQN